MKWPEIDLLVERAKEFPSGRKLRILDVGCGSGRLFGAFSGAGLAIKYLGIDESPKIVEEARKSFPNEEFRVLPMQEIDRINDTFDIIAFVASFHHLRTRGERLDTLEKTRKLLVSDGMLFMTNWNLLSEENRKRYSPMKPGWSDFSVKFGNVSRFYHAFDPRELSGLIEETGYIVREQIVNERNIVTIAK